MRSALSEPLVRKLSQYAPISGEDAHVLVEAARDVRTFAPREVIIGEGERPEHVHLIIEGWAIRYKLLDEGERTIMACLIPGDLCDIQGILLDQMDHTIGTVSRCKVAFIPRSIISRMMGREHNDLAQALWWSTLVDEATLREWLVNVGRRPAEQRIAHFICEMLLRLKAVGLNDGDSFELVPTQEDLADTLGLSDVHINRSLRQLREKGLLTIIGRRVIVPDLPRLKDFASFRSNYLHQRSRQMTPSD